MTDQAKNPPDTNGTEITFSFIKSNSYRVIYVDGAVGSPAPGGLIHAALYNERGAIPRTMVQSITGGRLGPPTTVDARPGIVREVEVSIMLSREAAIGLRDWLSKQITALENIVATGGKSSDEG